MNKRTKTNEIILHCAATKEGIDYKAADIKKWHLNQGWSDIGYHYIIDLNGTVEKGREESLVGSHCINHNSNSVGVCYIGGCDVNNKPKDTRTNKQKESMYKLVDNLMWKYGLTIEQVHCHNEYAAKACPSFKIDQFRKEFSEWLKKKDVILCPNCHTEIILK